MQVISINLWGVFIYASIYMSSESNAVVTIKTGKMLEEDFVDSDFIFKYFIAAIIVMNA